MVVRAGTLEKMFYFYLPLACSRQNIFPNAIFIKLDNENNATAFVGTGLFPHLLININSYIVK